MAEEKETVILDFQIETGDAVKEQEKLFAQLLNVKKAQADLNAEYKKGDKTLEDYSAETVKNRNEQLKIQTAYNATAKAATGVKSQFDKLIDTNKQLTKSVQSTGDTIKSTGDKFSEATKGINIHGVSVGDLSTKLASFAGPAGIATAAIGVVGLLGKAYASSTIGAKDLGFATNQAAAFTALLSNNLAGLISSAEDGEGFFSKVTDSFLRYLSPVAANAAKQIALAQEQMEDLGRNELEIRDKINERLEENSELNADIAAEATTYSDKIFKAGQIIDNLRKNEEELVDVKKQQLALLERQLSFDKENENLQTSVLEKQREISNIERDTEKRVQNINKLKDNINSAEDKRLGIVRKQIDAQEAADKRAGRTGGDVTLSGEDSSIKKIQDYSSNVADDALKLNQTILSSDSLFASASLSISKQIAEGKVANDQYVADNYIALEDQKLIATQMTLNAVGSLLSAFGIKSKLLSSGLATANTFLGVTEILKAPTAPFIEPFASVVRGAQIATAISTGLGAVAKINGVSFGGKAAGGGDFVTKGPTMLLVGDNPGGRERVTVNPLSGRGQTKVNRNHIAMAGGGSLVADSATKAIDHALYAAKVPMPAAPVLGVKQFARVARQLAVKQSNNRI